MMIKPIARVGKDRYSWTRWEKPDNLAIDNIPIAAGIYHLGCLDEHGDVIMLVPNTVLPGGAQDDVLDGLGCALYIGMATDFRDRYWTLVRSWKTSADADLHGCRKRKYDINAALLKTYPRDRIVCRCKPMVYHEPLSSEAEEIRKKITPHGNKRTATSDLIDGLPKNPRTDISSYAEGQAIRAYEQQFAHLPVLNTQRGEKLSLLPDEEFLEDIFGTDWLDDNDDE